MLYTEILNDNKDFLTLYKKGRYAASNIRSSMSDQMAGLLTASELQQAKRSAMPSAETEQKDLSVLPTAMLR